MGLDDSGAVGCKTQGKTLALFPDDREELPVLACEAIRVQLDKIESRRPRQWGQAVWCEV